MSPWSRVAAVYQFQDIQLDGYHNVHICSPKVLNLTHISVYFISSLTSVRT